MKIRLSEFASPFLTSPTRAQQVCAEIFAHWDIEAVSLDFSNICMITPSFANTLVMNMLHIVSIDELRERVCFENTTPHIDQAINRAFTRRLELGIELTAYMPA